MHIYAKEVKLIPIKGMGTRAQRFALVQALAEVIGPCQARAQALLDRDYLWNP